MAEVLITETDRRRLWATLWPLYKRGPLPRGTRVAYCSAAVRAAVAGLERGDPAYDKLRDALQGAATPAAEGPP